MDTLTITNIAWAIILLIATWVNYRIGWRKGITDGFTTTTVPIVTMLMKKGYITKPNLANRVDYMVVTRELVIESLDEQIKAES
jgi:hypothetical protein